jgi:hypothetical protein
VAAFEGLKKFKMAAVAMVTKVVKFQKDPLFGVNLTFVAPWLPWQQLPF